MNEVQESGAGNTTDPAVSVPADSAAVPDKVASSGEAGQAQAESNKTVRGAAAAAIQAGKPAQPPADRKSAKASFLVRFIITVLILSVAGLGYFAWEQQKAIDVLFGEYNRFNQDRSAAAAQAAAQLAALQEAGQALESSIQEQLQQARTQMNAQTAQIDALNRDLVATRMRITDSGAGASQAWMLTEAESLMRFAQQRLVLARDVRSAMGLLISADDLLKQLNAPAVFSAREALANDLAILQGVREVDIPGLYAQLGALAGRVLELQIRTTGDDARFEAPAPSGLAGDAGLLDRMKSRLDQYFVITRTDISPIPALTPEQAWVIKQAEALKLEQARIALLKGQQESWQAALDDAVAGISENLQGEGLEALLTNLTTLRDTPIVTNIPPASNGLTAIRQVLPQALIETGSTAP